MQGWYGILYVLFVHTGTYSRTSAQAYMWSTVPIPIPTGTDFLTFLLPSPLRQGKGKHSKQLLVSKILSAASSSPLTARPASLVDHLQNRTVASISAV